MLYKLFQKIEKGNFYLLILWGQNQNQNLISKSHQDIKSRKGIKDKGQQIEGKCSEHRKHGEEEVTRGLKKL